MSILQKALGAWLLASLSLAILAGCGGSGGSNAGGPATPVSGGDANPTGLWQGTFTPTDGKSRAFNAVVAPDGQFAGVVASSGGNGRFLFGTSDTTSSEFNATGTVFVRPGEALLPNGQTSDPITVVDGKVVERVSLTGAYSGGGEAASFVLTYDGNTARGASLAAVAGVYGTYPPPPPGTAFDAVLTANGDQLTLATSAGCNGAGTIAVFDATLNIYRWSLRIAPCNGAPEISVAGLATLTDDPRGGIGNLLSLYGATTSRDQSLIISFSK
jgi:hypothetical protein